MPACWIAVHFCRFHVSEPSLPCTSADILRLRSSAPPNSSTQDAVVLNNVYRLLLFAVQGGFTWPGKSTGAAVQGA